MNLFLILISTAGMILLFVLLANVMHMLDTISLLFDILKTIQKDMDRIERKVNNMEVRTSPERLPDFPSVRHERRF